MKTTVESSASVRARIDGLERRYSELCADQARYGSELQAASEASSRAYVDSGDLSGTKVITELETRLNVVGRGLVILTQQTAAAERDLKVARATELRQRASELREESVGIEKRCEKALGELSKLQGIEYTRMILEAQRKGGWLGTGPVTEFDSPHEVGAEPAGVNKGHYAISKSRRLITEANELDRQAEEIETELAAEWQQTA